MQIVDTILRDGNGNKLKEFSEEYILVGKAFVDVPPVQHCSS